jgi:hypothetical protein
MWRLPRMNAARRLLAILCILASSFGQLPAFADEFSDFLLKDLEPYRADCRDAGGELSQDADKAITRLDLDGDGREDAIVDMSAARCTTDFTPYCGTGGCPLLIYSARGKGRYLRIFDGRVLSYEIEHKGRRKAISFRLHGSFCGKHGPELCGKRVVITGRPFAFKN